jgi:hypothetical protein
MKKGRAVESIHSLITFDMTDEEKSLFEKQLIQKNERNFGRKIITFEKRKRKSYS